MSTVITHDPLSRRAGEGNPDHADETLLDRYLSGGEGEAEDAFRELVFRHRSRLKRRGVALSMAFLLYAFETESSSAAATEIDGSLVEATLRTSLGTRKAAPAAPIRPARRISRGVLLSLFVLATAASAFGYEYRSHFGKFKTADFYQSAMSLIPPLPWSAAPHCH